MKNKSFNSFLGGLLILAAFASFHSLGSSPSFAEENNIASPGMGHQNQRWAPDFHGRDTQAARRGYFLGVCVGQNLAQQGITIPQQQPGEKPTLDQSTEAAMKAAVETCRQQMRGTEPSPSPSGAPSTTPSTGTSPAPTETGTPSPTEPVIPTPANS